MTVERALRLMAGAVILVSLGLAHWFSNNWLWLTAFVGLEPVSIGLHQLVPGDDDLSQVWNERCWLYGFTTWESRVNDRVFHASQAARLDSPERLIWLPPGEVVAHLGLAPGMTVADIGAGTGYFTLPIAKQVGPHGKVYAVDLQPDMLAILAKKVGRRQRPQRRTYCRPGPPDKTSCIRLQPCISGKCVARTRRSNYGAGRVPKSPLARRQSRDPRLERRRRAAARASDSPPDSGPECH